MIHVLLKHHTLSWKWLEHLCVYVWVCAPEVLKPASRALALCNMGNLVKVPALESPHMAFLSQYISQPVFPTAVLEKKRGILNESFAYG